MLRIFVVIVGWALRKFSRHWKCASMVLFNMFSQRRWPEYQGRSKTFCLLNDMDTGCFFKIISKYYLVNLTDIIHYMVFKDSDWSKFSIILAKIFILPYNYDRLIPWKESNIILSTMSYFLSHFERSVLFFLFCFHQLLTRLTSFYDIFFVTTMFYEFRLKKMMEACVNDNC